MDTKKNETSSSLNDDDYYVMITPIKNPGKEKEKKEKETGNKIQYKAKFSFAYYQYYDGW